MKNLILFLVLFSFDINLFSQVAHDFDEEKYGFSTPEELAKSFFSIVVSKDTSKSSILKHFINQGVAKYMVSVVAKQNVEEALLKIDTGFHHGEQQYVQLIKNLVWKTSMEIENFPEFKIEDIRYNIEDYYNLDPILVFTVLEILFSNGDKDYSIEISVLGRLKQKWFVLEPSLSFDNNIIPFDVSQEDFENKLKNSVDK